MSAAICYLSSVPVQAPSWDWNNTYTNKGIEIGNSFCFAHPFTILSNLITYFGTVQCNIDVHFCDSPRWHTFFVYTLKKHPTTKLWAIK